ncbi:MAG: two-component regulator propeller domain-containing protein [Vicinamibacterales bacterium]
MSPRALALVVALFCLGRPAHSSGRDLPLPLTDYRITSWVGGDGISLGEVRSIVQDQAGYLWLASDDGLVRFDGSRFATTDLVAGSTRLPAAPARALRITRDGSLWVGYSDGHGIYRIKDGEVRDVYLKNEISGFVYAITQDRSGTLWAGHDEGLHRFSNGRWEPVSLPGTETRRRVLDVFEDRGGTLWVAGMGGLYRRLVGGEFEKAPQSRGVARAISEDAIGRIWTTDERDGFRRADAPDANDLFEARGMSLLHDRRGNLWVTTIGQGLWQVGSAMRNGRPPRIRKATVQSGLVNDENSAMLEDRDGNIWVASIRGLSRLTPEPGMSVVDIGVVRALALGTDGTAWAGTTTGLIALSGVTPRSRGETHVVSTAPVSAVHTAANGTVWAATDEEGLHRMVAGRLVPVAHSGPRLRRITSITSDRYGALWLCDEVQGLTRLKQGHLERIVAANGETSARPLFTHVDDADRVWIAFQGGTVGRLDRDGRMERYGPQEGLSFARVSVIHHDRWGDIWVGGDAGLSRLRGNRFETLSFRSEARGRPVAAILDDEEGDLWIAFSIFGVIHVSRDDISRALSDASYLLSYNAQSTGHGAGYPDLTYGSSAGAGANHTFWFLTTRGVTVIDPRALREQDAPAIRPRIEGVTADDRRYGSAPGMTLPPRTSRLRIDYTVVNLSSSSNRIRFRYRLDGFDGNWVDGTGPRQAFYTNLPPGSYRFRLQASNNTGTWNDAEARWSFSIKPMFYQTRWFYFAGSLGLLLCAVGAWRLRLRRLRKQLAMMFGERIRMSREIHDTLLQSLVGVTLQLDSASRDLESSPSRTRAQLVGMRKQLEGYIRETRQSIWDLRSPTLDQHGLVGALRATGDRLTAGKVRFALTVTGTPRPCPPHVETHVLRIGHEAVMNAVRHSQARQVQMDIGFDRKVLRLRIADDGRGFDAEQVAASGPAMHYGLATMRERAADAGGHCTIQSVPGSGAQVIAEFPLAPTG